MNAVFTDTAKEHEQSLGLDLRGVGAVDITMARDLAKIMPTASFKECRPTIYSAQAANAHKLVEAEYGVRDVRTTSALMNTLKKAFEGLRIHVSGIS